MNKVEGEMDAQGVAKGISGKALLVVLILAGGAVGIYARSAMAPPKNYIECVLETLSGKPQGILEFASMYCASQHPNWKEELGSGTALVRGSGTTNTEDLLRSMGY